MADINNSVLYNIGIRIKEERNRIGMSQTELADAIGSNKSKISNIENGRSIPTIETLVKIGNAFNIPVTEFLVINEVSNKENVTFISFMKKVIIRVSKLKKEKQESIMVSIDTILNIAEC